LLALFDNVSGNLGGSVLDRLLTSSVWEGRILGESRTVQVPPSARGSVPGTT